MSHPGSELGKVEEDINLAVKTAQQGLTGLMEAVNELGKRLAQLIGNIKEYENQVREAAARQMTTGVQGEVAPNFNPKPLASGLDHKEKSLSEKNKELQTSLEQLRAIQGQLPQDTIPSLQQKRKKIEESMQSVETQNQLVVTAVKDPAHANDLGRLNIITAILGHDLTDASKEKAAQVKASLETELNKISTTMKELRGALAPTKPAEPQSDSGLDQSDADRPQFKPK